VFNDAGIEPILLKGCGFLLTATEETLGERIIADLDMLVPEDKAMSALLRLGGVLGYNVLPPDSGHVYGTFYRPQDVGTIDLHHRAPGLPISASYTETVQSCTTLHTDNGRCLLPSTSFRIAHLVAHDLLHNSGYLRGDLQLRGLLDLKQLIDNSPALCWHAVMAMFPARMNRDALVTELLLLNRLFGVRIPRALDANAVARLQCFRSISQARTSRTPCILTWCTRLFYHFTNSASTSLTILW
jgi:hypothetical protein